MPRVFYDEDADPHALIHETIAVLGYGNQGRAQALNLRDSGLRVIVGNRRDEFRTQAERDGLPVVGIAEAARQATMLLMLLPDEAQPAVFAGDVQPSLAPGKGLVFAHGFAVRYGLIAPPADVDVLLVAPRLPGQYVRSRYLDEWGVPAFVAVGQDATGRARQRLLALARALGVTRCAALEVGFAEETELDHFSEHFLYPLVFRALEIAFEALLDAGYEAETALMELYGSGELGEVLQAAGREGLYEMIRTHASPACQVGIAQHWEDADGTDAAMRRRIAEVLAAIRDGHFAKRLADEQEAGYPELARWRTQRPATLMGAERRLRALLRERRE